MGSMVFFLTGMFAMTVVVTASNFLVQYPINDWLTWGAITYPVSFLITDLTNRHLGPQSARRVVYAGFSIAVILSVLLATPRIAVASGSAFLTAQLLDIYVFNRVTKSPWWLPPLLSSVLGSTVDTALFFTLAFAATDTPWITWAIGDLGIKLAIALLMLIPFRLLAAISAPLARGSANQ